MSHSRRETDGCLAELHVDEEPPSSMDAVESWLSSRYAVPTDPDDPDVPAEQLGVA